MIRSPSFHIASNPLALLALALVWAWIVEGAASEHIGIDLKKEAQARGPTILLQEIADFNGGPSDIRARIGSTAVGRAPGPGQSRLLHTVQIERSLRQAGFEDNAWHLVANGPVKVTRASQSVSADRICTAVREFIQAKAPWEPEQLHIRPIRYRHTLIVPEGALRLTVTAPKHTDWLGSMLFGVQISVDDLAVRKISVPVALEVLSPVIMAAKPLGRNQPIAPDDIRIVEMNLARAPANAVTDPHLVVGHKTNRAIAANAILRSDQVKLPPTVRKGDLVKIIAESPALKVTIQGVARQDGGLGERIRVMNQSSQRTISARIMDARTVRVEF
jgi:flagellar basal body P-ring formation protein FlgA